MRRFGTLVVGLVVVAAIGAASGSAQAPSSEWRLAEASRALVGDDALRERIFAALDAAATAGTDPSISRYDVRAATALPRGDAPLAIVGGNTEYLGYPEAIHGETSLMNHVINHVGPEAARREVDFLAFHKDGACGGGGSCGDCRDYLMATTRWRDLLIACGQAGDGRVLVTRFADQIVSESDFPEIAPDATGLSTDEFQRLLLAASEARAGGVSLFTTPEEHLGVAALAAGGRIHRAAGADDAAFHYRYPIGAALQQAATYRDYALRAVLVVGEPGHLPRISYRDRQYGHEFSSFGIARGAEPIRLILVERAASEGESPRFRMTTFEDALPGAFSARSFMPEAIDRFLAERTPQ